MQKIPEFINKELEERANRNKGKIEVVTSDSKNNDSPKSKLPVERIINKILAISKKKEYVSKLKKKCQKIMSSLKNDICNFLFENYKTIIIGFTLLAILQATSCNIKDLLELKYSYELSYLYNLINSNSILNLTLEIVLVILVVAASFDRCKKKYLSLYYLFFCLSACFLLYNYESYDFSKDILGVSYYYILYLACIIPVVFDFLKLLVGGKTEIPLKTKAYVDEVPKEPDANSLRHKYAETIYGKLLKTDLTNESFTLGITGNWGSGKSTFLNDFKEILKKNNDSFFEYNPWNCQSTNQIVSDFFCSLGNKMVYESVSLNRLISKYSKELTKLNLHPILNEVLERMPSYESDSITELKCKIQKELKKLKHPLFVLVDDIDRLDKDEIFEVLRLIRNTAKFPNIIYIVTFDKTYVIQQLTKKGIENSKSYLEKIFPIEVALPKVEDLELFLFLKSQILRMCPKTYRVNSMLSKIDEYGQKTVVQVLNSYRKTKRFARIFATNAEFLMSQSNGSNINLYDLFILELINYEYPNVYSCLRTKPELFLNEKLTENGFVYCLHDELPEQALAPESNIQSLTKGEIKDDKCYGLLKILFSNEKPLDTSDIRIPDKFDKYFCLGVPGTVISESEFKDLLNMNKIDYKKDGIKSTINKWIYGKFYKRTSSFYHNFISYYPQKQKWEQVNYSVALVYWLMLDQRPSYYIEHSICNCLTIDRLGNEFLQDVKDTIYKHANEAFYKNSLIINKALAYAYKRVCEKNDLIFTNGEIAEMMIWNFRVFVKGKRWISISLIKEDGNELNTFAEDCAVEIDGKWTNPIAEEIVNWAIEDERKSRHEDFSQEFQTSMKNSAVIYEKYKTVYDKVFARNEDLVKCYFKNAFHDLKSN